MVQNKKDQFTEGSKNVFEDLGLPNPEERLIKAQLIHKIGNLIQQRQLTQMQASKLLDINQPKISDLIHGKAFGYSVERLFRFLNALSIDIEIKMIDKQSNDDFESIVLSARKDLPEEAKT